MKVTTMKARMRAAEEQLLLEARAELAAAQNKFRTERDQLHRAKTNTETMLQGKIRVLENQLEAANLRAENASQSEWKMLAATDRRGGGGQSNVHADPAFQAFTANNVAGLAERQAAELQAQADAHRKEMNALQIKENANVAMICTLRDIIGELETATLFQHVRLWFRHRLGGK